MAEMKCNEDDFLIFERTGGAGGGGGGVPAIHARMVAANSKLNRKHMPVQLYPTQYSSCCC